MVGNMQIRAAFRKYTALSETPAGKVVLVWLMEHPDTVLGPECMARPVALLAGEAGGCFWWCSRCNELCSPNRPCAGDCGAPRR